MVFLRLLRRKGLGVTAKEFDFQERLGILLEVRLGLDVSG